MPDTTQTNQTPEWDWNNLTNLNWWLNPLGTGDKATSPVQIGLTGLGLWQKQNQFEDQLEQARQAYAFSKGNTQANFLTQGANFLNQGLFQLENLNAFNPNAAAERAQNMGSMVNTLNQAGSQIQLGNNAFSEQANAIAKYNQLANR